MIAEIVIFRGLLKNAQMQVELCEIPLTGAPEILRHKEISIEAYLAEYAAISLPRA